MIVGTEKVSEGSGGVRRRDAAVLATANAQMRMERWSPRGALGGTWPGGPWPESPKTRSDPTEFSGWTARTSDIGISI